MKIHLTCYPYSYAWTKSGLSAVANDPLGRRTQQRAIRPNKWSARWPSEHTVGRPQGSLQISGVVVAEHTRYFSDCLRFPIVRPIELLAYYQRNRYCVANNHRIMGLYSTMNPTTQIIEMQRQVWLGLEKRVPAKTILLKRDRTYTPTSRREEARQPSM